jgi:hypothetical protein
MWPRWRADTHQFRITTRGGIGRPALEGRIVTT